MAATTSVVPDPTAKNPKLDVEDEEYDLWEEDSECSYLSDV